MTAAVSPRDVRRLTVAGVVALPVLGGVLDAVVHRAPSWPATTGRPTWRSRTPSRSPPPGSASGAGGLVELGINVLTLALSVAFLRWAWRRRAALLHGG